MSDFDYTPLDIDEYYKSIDQFVENNGHDDGTIPEDEYDKLFDLIAEELNHIGKFVEGGTFEGEDFSSSRYVDQISFINVVVEKAIEPETLILAGLRAVEKAHRPVAYGFEWEEDYIAVFPGKKSIGTIDSSKLNVPIP